jgi:hypothetical protein
MAEITDWTPPKNEDQVSILPRLGSIEKRQATSEMLSRGVLGWTHAWQSLDFRQLNCPMQARFAKSIGCIQGKESVQSFWEWEKGVEYKRVFDSFGLTRARDEP